MLSHRMARRGLSAAIRASVVSREALAQPAPLSASAFSLISWNVNGLRATGRVKGLARLVAERCPDLIVLQETKLQTHHAAPMRDALASALPGYDVWFYSSIGRKGYAGSAALVRRGAAVRDAVAVDHASDAEQASLCPETPSPAAPLRRVAFGLHEPASDIEGRAITLEYDHFAVVALYVPNSGAKLARLDYRTGVWDCRLAAYVEELEDSTGKAVIVAGDLNVAHRDEDVHNFWAPHIAKQAGCTRAERESFGAWLEASGRVDVHRALHGDAAAQFTYWSTRARGKATNKGLRLDYFVAPRSLCESGSADCAGAGDADGQRVAVHAVDIVHDGYGGANAKGSASPSDHCPIELTLRVR